MHHQEFCPDFKCECVKIVEIARIPKTKSLGIPKHRNEVTLHDINFESVSKSLWKWAMSGRIHEETTELKKELPLGSARFGTEGVVAQFANKLEDTQTIWTSQTQYNSVGNKESVGPVVVKYVAWET